MTTLPPLVASPDESDGSLKIHQDARIYLSKLARGKQVTHDLAAGRHAWVQVLRGAVTLKRIDMKTSDGAAVNDDNRLEIVAGEPAEIMLFDLA